MNFLLILELMIITVKDDIDFNCSFNDHFLLKDKETFMVSNVYHLN